mmetsp:Transcript_30488/g.72182  ORF Transcript_30488/g.72182 Transcript_30488/m.72182 type:complete len:237 (-) Transcript_30488:202-912(-)
MEVVIPWSLFPRGLPEGGLGEELVGPLETLGCEGPRYVEPPADPGVFIKVALDRCQVREEGGGVEGVVVLVDQRGARGGDREVLEVVGGDGERHIVAEQLTADEALLGGCHRELERRVRQQVINPHPPDRQHPLGPQVERRGLRERVLVCEQPWDIQRMAVLPALGRRVVDVQERVFTRRHQRGVVARRDSLGWIVDWVQKPVCRRQLLVLPPCHLSLIARDAIPRRGSIPPDGLR